MNDDKPLFLPTGSIRSILVLLVGISVLGMYAYKINVPPELMAVFNIMIGFYFGSRGK
jgi:hypothetical protein